MRLRFLLALFLLAACNAEASGHSSTEKNTLLQVQSLPGAFEKENKGTFGLVLFLWASALPVTLICSYEVCRSIGERKRIPFGGSFCARAAGASGVSHDMGVFPFGERKDSASSSSRCTTRRVAA